MLHPLTLYFTHGTRSGVARSGEKVTMGCICMDTLMPTKAEHRTSVGAETPLTSSFPSFVAKVLEQGDRKHNFKGTEQTQDCP